MRSNAFFIMLCAGFMSVVAFLACAWLLHQRLRHATPGVRSSTHAVAAPATPARPASANPLESDLDTLLRSHPALACSSAQRAKLQALYDELQRTRRAHEAAIAVRHPRGRDAAEITIPAYPEIGVQLRERFMSALTAALGAAYAHRFEAEAGDDLARQMCGFGQQMQVLIVRLDRATGAYEIEHEYRAESPAGAPARRTELSRVSRTLVDHYAALAALLPK